MTRQPTVWRTSSFSSNGSNCVEVRHTTDDVWLRDSKNRRGPTARLGLGQWRAFLAEVAADRPSANGAARVLVGPDGERHVEEIATSRVLRFTADEWAAFRAGVHAGEFDRLADVA